VTKFISCGFENELSLSIRLDSFCILDASYTVHRQMFDYTGSEQVFLINRKLLVLNTPLRQNICFGQVGVVMSCKGSLIKQNVCHQLL